MMDREAVPIGEHRWAAGNDVSPLDPEGLKQIEQIRFDRSRGSR
jgi:hypothetical protein